ncbi:hypothetical protein [Sphingobium sp. CAP-1]|uniref:hypothetical protein n=1 Tax=Sphingobium sp. CAP-1 TaxID=2676077 RepID=UPI0012BB3AA5|nr:hypothetical protein [Sphingobium sp. CAP-1]QGP81263.1 hypothetical protein GL174_19725 [Sphingobium sp. CAP-1]
MDSASDGVGADRLRALRRRAAQAEETPAPAVAPQHSARPALADNGFALLELPIAAGSAAINEAYDRLSFEPDRDEAKLAAARAALMAPRDRLAAEIGWAPGLARLSLDALIVALRANDAATLQSLHGKASGLARLNIAHALLDMDRADVQAATAILSDARDVDADAVLELLDEARFAAREREIDRPLFDDCFDDHARTLGGQAALAFAGSAIGRAALARSLQAMGSPAGRFDAGLRDALLAGYGREIAQPLDQSHGRIMASIEALKAEPGSQSHATGLLTALDVWSTLRRPMQLHEAARGLDDPASGEIFAAVRSLSVALSNQHEQYEIALRLGRALLSSFALVPIHRAALERELPTLIGNAALKRAQQLHQMALAQLKPFARQVEAGGLDGAGGLAGSINALIADVECLTDDGALGLVFLALRDIAIQLHNQGRERRAAYAMIVWLTRHGPPREVAQKLEEDLRHFGVEADVAVREDTDAAPAPDAPRAPTRFGRAGQPPSRPPEARTPPPRLPNEPRSPPVRTRRSAGVVRGVTVMVILLGLIYGRATQKAERRRERAAAMEQSETPAITAMPATPSYNTTPSYNSPSYSTVRSRAEAEALLSRLRERSMQDTGQQPGTPTEPRFVPGQPMSDARPDMPLGSEP